MKIHEKFHELSGKQNQLGIIGKKRPDNFLLGLGLGNSNFWGNFFFRKSHK